MDPLTKKIIENARKRKEKQTEMINQDKENQNSGKLVSPLVRKFEKNTFEKSNLSKEIAHDTSLPSVRQRIDSILNCTNDSIKKEPEAKIKKEIKSHDSNPNSPERIGSPSKLLNSPFMKFNIVKESHKSSIENPIVSPKKNEIVEETKLNEKEEHLDPEKIEKNIDPVENIKLSDDSEISFNDAVESSVKDVKFENVPNISSVSSISDDFNVYIPHYPKISEESGSTIGSSMLCEEETEKKPTLPKPVPVRESDSKIKEIPNPASFPSTPNTPKMIVVEEKSDQLKNTKPNEYCKLNVMQSTTTEVLPKRDKENFSTRSHILSSSTSSLISFEGCILHDQKIYDETLASIKKNINENQSIIHQTSQALSIAYLQNKNKNYLSKEMIEAERLSLLACQKRKYYIEFEEKVVARAIPCKCSKNMYNCNYSVDVILKEFSLFIKNEYFNNFDADLGVFHFCFVISQENKIFTTNAVSINDIDKNCLKFSGSFSFNNIESTEFIRIQLFVLTQLNEGQRPSTVFQKLKIGKKDVVPKVSRISKKQVGLNQLARESFSPTNTSNFLYIGEVNCPVDKSGLLKLSLSNIVYDCPITGSFSLNCESKPIDHCMAKGFLTNYVIVGSSVAWQRYWCGLFKDHLCMWNYPQDETTKNPVRKIRLKWSEDLDCIRTVPIEECSRKDTFEIKVIEPSSSKAKGYVELSHIFAADSSEEKKKWMNSFVIHIKKFRTLKNSNQQNIIQ